MGFKETYMIIRVKQEHIKEGIRNSPWNCAVALAIKDANLLSRKSKAVSVSGSIEVDKFVYPCPRSVDRFINKFDAGKKVKPFNFKLD